MEEIYETIKQMLQYINYDKHQWQLCGDLKVAALVKDLQGGYTN